MERKANDWAETTWTSVTEWIAEVRIAKRHSDSSLDERGAWGKKHSRMISSAFARECNSVVSEHSIVPYAYQEACLYAAMGELQTEAEMVRQQTLELYSTLGRVDDEDLDFGIRLEMAATILNPKLKINTNVAVEALTRVLHCASESIDDGVRGAMVRYMALPEYYVPLRQRNALFVGLLESESEEQAVAAARSLEEVGDKGVIPSLRQVARRTSRKRLKAEIERAADVIEAVHGTSTNSTP